MRTYTFLSHLVYFLLFLTLVPLKIDILTFHKKIIDHMSHTKYMTFVGANFYENDANVLLLCLENQTAYLNVRMYGKKLLDINIKAPGSFLRYSTVGCFPLPSVKLD